MGGLNRELESSNEEQNLNRYVLTSLQLAPNCLECHVRNWLLSSDSRYSSAMCINANRIARASVSCKRPIWPCWTHQHCLPVGRGTAGHSDNRDIELLPGPCPVPVQEDPYICKARSPTDQYPETDSPSGIAETT